MARWTDIATWRGPTVNRDAGGTVETRGVVVHIAEGTYEGTVSWQRNATAEVSSHFIVDRTGAIAQMVDTADKAWTQKAGNGHWISVECAGFSTTSQYHTPGSEKLTDAQVAAVGRILAKAHQVYGVPLQIATSPTGRGLGHHSMGGTAWGHLDCPGPPIIAQKPAIVAAATNGGDDMSTTSDNIIKAWSVGNAKGSGGEDVEPVKWEVAAEQWRAATTAQINALTAAVTALAKGGTSLDTAAVLTAIEQAGATESAAVQALQAQVADLQTKLASAGAALG